MSDYRLIIRVKNNLLHEQMLDKGIRTQSELARVCDVSATEVGKIANLKVGAYNADGKLSNAVSKLCDYFGCLPEDVFPSEVLHVGIPGNVVERVVSSKEVANYLESQTYDPISLLDDESSNEYIRNEIKRLTPRQQRVVTARFFEDKTLDEVGDELGLSGARVREIQSQALRRLRIKTLRNVSDDEIKDMSDTRELFEVGTSRTNADFKKDI